MKNAFHKQNQQWKKKIKGQLKCINRKKNEKRIP